MRKNVLGRGLEALISQDLRESLSETERVRDIPVESIDPNPEQPRERFDEGQLGELAESIRRHGVLQPVVVRRRDDRYQLVVGERRFRASRMAGMSTIPAIVRDIDDDDTLKLALLENLQREDLNPIEEARGYAALRKSHDLAVQEIADLLGRSRSSVSNSMRLLDLPARVIEMIESGKLTAGHARAILSVSGEAAQVEWAERAASQGFTVREIEEAVPGKRRRRAGRKRKVDPHVAALEERAELELGTRVRIMPKPKGGEVRIDYYSNDELVSLLERLGVDTEL